MASGRSGGSNTSLDPPINPGTQVMHFGGTGLALPLGPREAFLAAHEKLAALAGAQRVPSFAIVAVNARAQVVDSLLLEDRQALVIGRHSQCGLRLPEGSISLRHLAALVRFQGARPSLHLWDLGTERPFLTEDMASNAAVIAEGPAYISVGQYALWFLPTSGRGALAPGDAEEAWSRLPARRFLDRREPAALPRASSPTFTASDSGRALVTAVGAPLLLDDLDEAEIPWGILRTEYAAHRVKVERRVSAERLERGVLVGRYSRCGVSTGGDLPEISRVHLLLVRIDQEIWAIDTASTAGVWRDGEQVTAEVLSDVDRLALASSEVVTLGWRRIEHPEA
jgi:hypothetical protein